MRKQKETAQADIDSTCDSPTSQHYRQKILKYMQNRNVVAFTARPSAKCSSTDTGINPLNPELNPICYLLALLGAHHFLHVNRIWVKLLTFRLLMSYIYIWSTHS